MAEKAFEDLTGGIHYIKDDNQKPKGQKAEVCVQCGSPATCMPRVYVPCSKLSINQIEDISALMSVTFCDRHFIQLKPAQFLHRAEVRVEFERLFRERGSNPNFDKAVIGRIELSNPDFARGQKAVEMARKN